MLQYSIQRILRYGVNIKKVLSEVAVNPKLIRQVWMLVDTGVAPIPLTLDDRSLVQWLVRQLCMERAINSQEAVLLDDYLRSRIPLIRQMAGGY